MQLKKLDEIVLDLIAIMVKDMVTDQIIFKIIDTATFFFLLTFRVYVHPAGKSMCSVEAIKVI